MAAAPARSVRPVDALLGFNVNDALPLPPNESMYSLVIDNTGRAQIKLRDDVSEWAFNEIASAHPLTYRWAVVNLRNSADAVSDVPNSTPAMQAEAQNAADTKISQLRLGRRR